LAAAHSGPTSQVLDDADAQPTAPAPPASEPVERADPGARWRIISVTRADHTASRRVMEKCGLTFQGEVVHKGGLVVWYAINRADWQARQGAASP
jgi:hypothetical protein